MGDWATDVDNIAAHLSKAGPRSGTSVPTCSEPAPKRGKRRVAEVPGMGLVNGGLRIVVSTMRAPMNLTMASNTDRKRSTVKLVDALYTGTCTRFS